MIIISQKEKELLLELNKEFTENLLWGIKKQTIKTPEEIIISRCKYAKIYIKKEDKHSSIYWVDNESLIAYKAKENNYYNSLQIPFEEIKYFKFDRCCRGMDL